jgi:hypothetical protein
VVGGREERDIAGREVGEERRRDRVSRPGKALPAGAAIVAVGVTGDGGDGRGAKLEAGQDLAVVAGREEGDERDAGAEVRGEAGRIERRATGDPCPAGGEVFDDVAGDQGVRGVPPPRVTGAR